MSGVDAATTLAAILAFLAREQAALNRNYAELCARPVDSRVAEGHALGPLTFLGTDAEGRWRLRLDQDDSRFREDDAGYLGPAATGEAAIGRGLPVRYVAFDAADSTLLLVPARAADSPPPGRLYLDARKVDLTDLYRGAAEAALSGPNPGPLVAAMALGGSSRRDGPRAAIYADLAGGLGLNRSQREAYGLLAAAPIGLVQGPPGTGKTHVLGLMVAALVSEGKRVLVCALAHRAVNNALNACAASIAGSAPLLKLSEVSQASGLSERVVVIGRARDVASRLGTPIVVGTTIARVPGLVRAGAAFDVVVFDEAGQLTLPQALCAATAAPRALLFGDHRQLPPILQAEHPPDEELARSAFELLLERHPSVLLRTSYRLNDALVAFPSQAYYAGQLRASRGSAGRRLALDLPRDHPLFPLLDPAAPLVWAELDHRFQRPPVQSEAALAASCVELVLSCGLPAEEIAVISPYRAQNQAIRACLADLAATDTAGADTVVVDTVERMQGQERELVIISLAISDPVAIARQARFLYLPNRLNVAVTRARTKCVVLGNVALLNSRSDDAAVLRGTTALRRLASSAFHIML